MMPENNSILNGREIKYLQTEIVYGYDDRSKNGYKNEVLSKSM